MTEKGCLRCRRTLSVDLFSKHRARPDGLQAYCKECTRDKNAASLAKNAARLNVAAPSEKCCARCRQTKPSEAFYADRRRRDGLYANCRDCHREVTDAWKAAHPALVRAGQVSSRARHAEARRIAAREYHRMNRAAAIAASAAWKRENRARATALETLRRARKAGAAGVATAEQIAARIAYYGHKCWMCGAAWEHIDHVKPVSRGGSNWPANLRPACGPCNLSKGARWPLGRAR